MEKHRLWHSRGYLPHFDDKQLLQFITFRLADSLPPGVAQERWDSLPPSQKVAKQYELESLLDKGSGSCILQKTEYAVIVENQLLQHDQTIYRLLAWVIMPNHAHLLIETLPGHSLSKAMQLMKGASAFHINRLRGSSGRLWQPEYYDRYIQDENHYINTVEYIELNPVKAGLVDSKEKWRFSSANRRRSEADPI